MYKEFQLSQKIFYLYILQVLIEIATTHVQLIFLLSKLSSTAIQNVCHFCDLIEHSDLMMNVSEHYDSLIDSDKIKPNYANLRKLL